MIAPEVYMVIGISVAIQHLAGTQDSNAIITINKEGDAPIARVADISFSERMPDLTGKL